MRIDVHVHSILRDCLPSDAEGGRATVEVPEGASIADLVRQMGIDKRLGYDAEDLITGASWHVMVSGKIESNLARELQPGDQVRILPPVGGG
jgi:sulfur carrier protein ThiS